jgi:hypothetical protein
MELWRSQIVAEPAAPPLCANSGIQAASDRTSAREAWQSYDITHRIQHVCSGFPLIGQLNMLLQHNAAAALKQSNRSNRAAL